MHGGGAKRRLVEVPRHRHAHARPNDRRHGRAAGPLSHWIGAGGSMVLESNLATGALGEHYVAMANMLHIP